MSQTSQPPLAPKSVPKPRAGLLHIVDATGYSYAGFQRLMQETAARLEVIGLLIGCGLLAILGAKTHQWLIFLGLSGLVLLVEALNTALEVLTDRISPEWSLEAKHAKDLGSFAVSLTLIATTAYLALTLWSLL